MVRLTLLLLLLAGPVGAKCFGPPFPELVHYPDGRLVENLSHTAQDLTYRSMMPDGTKAVMTVRNGLFNLASTNHGATLRYDWITALPALGELAPGFRGVFEADMVVEHAARSFYKVDVEVLRAEVVKVDDCDYPVLVIRRIDTLNGKQQADVTLWLSTALRFPLRVEAKADGRAHTFAVEEME